MGKEVHVRRLGATLVVSKRLPVRLSEIGGIIGPAFGEVYGHLGARGVAGDGPPFVIYHGSPAESDPFDIEVCAPVNRRAEPPAGWQVQELPAGSFATLVHVGAYDSLGVAYDRLTAWIRAHDLAFAGPPREVYMSGPETPPEQVRTIIEFPVEEVAAPVATT
jgi:effector-binding domain-containing protein